MITPSSTVLFTSATVTAKARPAPVPSVMPFPAAAASATVTKRSNCTASTARDVRFSRLTAAAFPIRAFVEASAF